MICPYCGKTISDASQFCSECGQAVVGGEKNSDSELFWNKVQQEKLIIEKENRKNEEKQNRIKKAKITKILGIFSLCAIVVAIVVYVMVIVPDNKYKKATKLFEDGSYSEAKVLFEGLENYKDSADWHTKCDQKITEIAYESAVNKFNSGDYNGALEDFNSLGDYSNSGDYIGQCELLIASGASVGENIVLGNYGSDKNPIEWTVLERNDSDLLLISRYYVTSKVANGDQSLEYSDDRDRHDYHCWSQSTLREWLNNEFIKTSFSESQIMHLMTNIINTEEYSVDDYDGWNEEEITVTTEDKVYIPSKADVEYYNLSPVQSMRNPDGAPIEGWLRDRGHGIAFQSTLNDSGDYGSEWHFYSSYGIRPIIRLSLDDVE